MWCDLQLSVRFISQGCWCELIHEIGLDVVLCWLTQHEVCMVCRMIHQSNANVVAYIYIYICQGTQATRTTPCSVGGSLFCTSLCSCVINALFGRMGAKYHPPCICTSCMLQCDHHAGCNLQAGNQQLACYDACKFIKSSMQDPTRDNCETLLFLVR